MTIKISPQEKPAGKRGKQNSNTEKHARRLELIQKRLDAGLLSETFPQVASITIHIIHYYGIDGPAFMEQTVNMVPSSSRYLHMQCLGGKCIHGGFDLTPSVEELIRKKKKSGKGKMICGEKDAYGVPNHASIIYDISIKY